MKLTPHQERALLRRHLGYPCIARMATAKALTGLSLIDKQGLTPRGKAEAARVLDKQARYDVDHLDEEGKHAARCYLLLLAAGPRRTVDIGNPPKLPALWLADGADDELWVTVWMTPLGRRGLALLLDL